MAWAGLPENLPAQFELPKSGKLLILDGDGPAYVAAATVKTLPTAIRRFQQAVLERMFLTGCETARVHLTADWSRKAGRPLVKAVKPYQGNRKGKSKPVLLESLRTELPNHDLDNVSIILHEDVEADDAMIMDAYGYPDTGVISSEDKDLRLTPYQYHCMTTHRVMAAAGFGHIEIGYTPSGVAKPLGQGLKFFWWQMLMGDSADNVQGILTLDGKKCGIVGAYDALKGIHTEVDVANFVLGAYRKVNQNPLAEGALLWLLRSADDDVTRYFDAIALDPEVRDFIEHCKTLPWREEYVPED